MEGLIGKKFEDKVSEVYKEMEPLDCTREEFLALCVKERVDDRSQKYNKEFNHYLRLIEEAEISRSDLDRVSRSLESLSKLVTSSYKSLLKVLDRFS